MIALLVHGQSFKSDPATEEFFRGLTTDRLKEIGMEHNKCKIATSQVGRESFECKLRMTQSVKLNI